MPDYDYSQAGAYFITICVEQRKPLLGAVEASVFEPSLLGSIAQQGWEWLESQFQLVSVPALCVMPNHVHAIMLLTGTGRGGLQTAPTQSGAFKAKSLGRLVGAYKTHTTSQINQLRNTPGRRFWQRNYYERIIRNDTEFKATYDYIEANPLNWESDKEYVPN